MSRRHAFFDMPRALAATGLLAAGVLFLLLTPLFPPIAAIGLLFVAPSALWLHLMASHNRKRIVRLRSQLAKLIGEGAVESFPDFPQVPIAAYRGRIYYPIRHNGQHLLTGSWVQRFAEVYRRTRRGEVVESQAAEEVLWAYGETDGDARRRQIVLLNRFRRLAAVRVRIDYLAQTLRRLADVRPYIVVGYSDMLVQTWNNDPFELVALIDRCRARQRTLEAEWTEFSGVKVTVRPNGAYLRFSWVQDAEGDSEAAAVALRWDAQSPPPASISVGRPPSSE